MGTWKSCLRFTIRELALLSVIVGLSLAWALDHQRLQVPLRYTGNPLHFAIEGNGFFQLTDPRDSSAVYTRRGDFSTNANGQLVIYVDGVEWLLSPPICIPSDATAIAITLGGLVFAQMPYTLAEKDIRGQTVKVRQPQLQALGQLQLASFSLPNKLQQVAPGIFTDTNESGPHGILHPGTRGVGLVRQGMIDQRQAQKFSFNPWR